MSQVTPVSEKTISLTSKQAGAEGPTPKNEFKKPMNQRSYFMSPTDALVSPCTQKLRKIPRKQSNQRPRFFNGRGEFHVPSSLANKENEQKAQLPSKKMAPLLEEGKAEQRTQPEETNV